MEWERTFDQDIMIAQLRHGGLLVEFQGIKSSLALHSPLFRSCRRHSRCLTKGFDAEGFEKRTIGYEKGWYKGENRPMYRRGVHID